MRTSGCSNDRAVDTAEPCRCDHFWTPGLRSGRFRVNIKSLGTFEAATFGRGDNAAIPFRRLSIWSGPGADCTDSGEEKEIS